MDDLSQFTFPMLLAIAGGLFAWGLARVFTGGDSRHRVSQRLSSEGKVRGAGGDGGERSIILDAGEVTSLAKALSQKSYLQKVTRDLALIFPRVTISKFIIFCGMIGVSVMIVMLALVDSLMVPFAAGAGAAYVPFVILANKAAKRTRTLNEQLPESLDFLARILRAGHSLTTGLQMMGSELPDPLSFEFRRCYDQHSLGQPLEDCLREMAGRIESTEFQFFVTAVLIQRQTGGDLSQVLGNISSTIRGRIRLAGFVKAKTAEGRFTGYILVGFPLLMFMVAHSLNPDYAGKLLNTGTGQKLLGTAIALQVIGLIAIRKITQVKV